MSKYIIALLLVLVLFLGSIIYKQHNEMVCHHFPIPESLQKKSTTEDVPFYLFLFFSKDDCMTCLTQIVEVVNALPPHYCVAGIVPGKELEYEKELRALTGVNFPLYRYRQFKKYLPWHTPTLFAVAPSGKIVLVFPGTQGKQIGYLETILMSTYGKLQHSFERANSASGEKEDR